MSVTPEIEMRVREAETGCDVRTRTLLEPTKKLVVSNKDILLQLVGGDAGPGIIPQLRDDVAELAEAVAKLTQTVATLAAQVAAQSPPTGIKPTLIKHGTTGVVLGGTGTSIWILADLIRNFLGG